jgi:adhesin transport system membrane fusion protein
MVKKTRFSENSDKTMIEKKQLRSANIILYSICIFWVTIFVWANYAVLEEVTRTMGRVVASSKIQVIQNLEGGIIKEILTKTGATVSSGDPLIIFESTRFQSELSALTKEKQAAEKNLKLLDEELGILEPLVNQGVESRMELIRLLQRISDAEAGLMKAEETLPILEDRLFRTTVIAPVDGIVNRLLVNTTGGVVQPGESLLEIVPIDDELIIEVEINPKDIAYVLPGQEAIIKLTAFDFSKFGSLKGKVINVGVDTIQKEDGSIWYICQIAVDGNGFTSIGKTIKILPGMVAEADIVSGEKTVLKYLLQPVTKIANEAFRER